MFINREKLYLENEFHPLGYEGKPTAIFLSGVVSRHGGSGGRIDQEPSVEIFNLAILSVQTQDSLTCIWGFNSAATYMHCFAEHYNKLIGDLLD